MNISIFDQEWEAVASKTDVRVEKQDKFYLSYSYNVAGIDYASGRIAPLVEFDWHIGKVDSGARNKSRWYREGAIVDVYYCPMWPAWSCLEPGGFMMTALLILASVLSGVVLHSTGLTH